MEISCAWWSDNHMWWIQRLAQAVTVKVPQHQASGIRFRMCAQIVKSHRANCLSECQAVEDFGRSKCRANKRSVLATDSPLERERPITREQGLQVN